MPTFEVMMFPGPRAQVVRFIRCLNGNGKWKED